MGIVSKKTGLTSHVLRAWENRYGAITPSRTSGNQRIYSDDDITRLLLLKKAVETGYRIGRIATLSTEDLRRMVREDALHESREISSSLLNDDNSVDSAAITTAHNHEKDADGFIQLVIEAVDELDPKKLRHVLNRASVSLGIHETLDTVVSRVMRAIGERWRNGRSRVYHEHMTTAAIRGFLETLLARSTPAENASLVIAATPPRQNHEIGALLAAVHASLEALNVVYLGANVPINDLAAACELHEARALLLSIVHPSGDVLLEDELRDLRSLCSSSTDIIVGGAASQSYFKALSDVDIEWISDFNRLRNRLAALA